MKGDQLDAALYVSITSQPHNSQPHAPSVNVYWWLTVVSEALDRKDEHRHRIYSISHVRA